MPGTIPLRRKALCIGINYTRDEESFHLRGGHNDAREMGKFLSECYGYDPEDIVILIDDDIGSSPPPTKKNIIEAMRTLVQDAKAGDRLFFHYSGHGTQVDDKDGDEYDKKDEAIYPVDYNEMQDDGKIVGYITDDEMHDIMVKPLPKDCHLTAVLDSCHSGTGLDLPYMYSTKGKIKHMRKGSFIKECKANVISWSGCKDSKDSVDVVINRQAFGALCNAFMTILRSDRNQSFQHLLTNIRKYLEHEGLSQEPQLSCSHTMDTNDTFVC